MRPLLFRCTTSLPRDHFTLSNSLTLPLKSKQRPRLPTKLVVIYSERSSFNLKIIAELNPFFVLLQFVALKNEDPQNQLCIKFKTLMTPSKIGRMQVRTKSRIKNINTWILFSDFCQRGAWKSDWKREVGVQENEDCRHKQSRSLWSSTQVRDWKSIFKNQPLNHSQILCHAQEVKVCPPPTTNGVWGLFPGLIESM